MTADHAADISVKESGSDRNEFHRAPTRALVGLAVPETEEVPDLVCERVAGVAAVPDDAADHRRAPPDSPWRDTAAQPADHAGQCEVHPNRADDGAVLRDRRPGRRAVTSRQQLTRRGTSSRGSVHERVWGGAKPHPLVFVGSEPGSGRVRPKRRDRGRPPLCERALAVGAVRLSIERDVDRVGHTDDLPVPDFLVASKRLVLGDLESHALRAARRRQRNDRLPRDVAVVVGIVRTHER